MTKYDIVLVAHEKDFGNLKFIIEQAETNLVDSENIHLILSERTPYTDLELLKTLTKKPVYIHKESDVLQIDRSRLKYRPNWIYQMLLKMLQNVTQNENFLIIESDCVILQPVSFFDNDKTTFYLCRDQNHQPYFNFNNKILGIGREYNHSFISEFMMYNKSKVKEMITKAGCNNTEEFVNLIYNTVDVDCYPADYELYGNFCYKFFPNEFEVRKIDFGFFGREAREKPFWDDNEIKFLIENNKNKPVISFHTWGLN
jgi:hypothetical protein